MKFIILQKTDNTYFSDTTKSDKRSLYKRLLTRYSKNMQYTK